MTVSFEEWIEQLKRIALEQYEFTENGITHTDWNAYRDYFDGGCTPAEAMAEDMSYD